MSQVTRKDRNSPGDLEMQCGPPTQPAWALKASLRTWSSRSVQEEGVLGARGWEGLRGGDTNLG